jgi:hypothetical protein
VLQFRSRIAEAARITFGGRRNVGQILGYQDSIDPKEYRARYERNELAGRVVEKAAQATWRAGAELIEDPAPDVITPFEQTWIDLTSRVNLWSMFYRADVLSGLGEYSVLLIGAKGALDQPLPKMSKQEDVLYLLPYSQEECKVETYEDDPGNARFGLPLTYQFQRLGRNGRNSSVQRVVHWTRVLHIADGLLDDPIHGQPRLRRIWNRLDDLDKVVGGGSEAFWMRAHQGLQFNIDPEVRVSEEDRRDMIEQIDKFAHGMQRTMRTRGMNIETLGSDVADFSGPAAIIVDLIAAGTGIPKRILMGSERGELASTQDRENWDAYVEDRRVQFAEPILIRQFADRLIEYGALPTPSQYEARWPEINSLTEDERSLVAERWSKMNVNMGETVVTPDEIRDRVLLLPPISDEDRARFEPPDEPVAGVQPAKKTPAQKLKAAKEALIAAKANAK